MMAHVVDWSSVISNKRFMWFLLYGGLNVHAVITLEWYVPVLSGWEESRDVEAEGRLHGL